MKLKKKKIDILIKTKSCRYNHAQIKLKTIKLTIYAKIDDENFTL